MKVTCLLKYSMKILALTLIMLISLAVSSAIFGVTSSSKSPDNSILPVLLFSAFNTILISLFIINSRFVRLKLILASSFILFGIQYFMTQIETLYFNNAVNMPLEQVLKVIGSGALSSVLFCSLAVIILGKFKKNLVSIPSSGISFKSIMPLSILAVSYVIVYFVFGYFVAWQFEAIRVYYSGSSHLINFFAHMAGVLRDDTWLPLFQLFRGFLWGGIAFIIIDSLQDKKILQYVMCSLLLGGLLAAPLMLPNAYMPDAVRFGHSIELSTSMVTFGILSVFLIRKFKNTSNS